MAIPLTGTKRCKICEQDLPVSEFPNNGKLRGSKNESLKSYCKLCNKARHAALYNGQVNRDRNLRLKYNMTQEEYDFLLICQNGVCAICGDADPRHVGGNFVVDHDHKTGVVRGLLCGPCNSALGLIGDRIELLAEMITYIRVGGTVGKGVEE